MKVGSTRLGRWTAIAHLTLVLSVVVAPVSARQSGDTLEALRSQGSIRIANTQSSPPWSMLDDQNRPTGYDVDVAREVARRMGMAKVDFIADSYKNFVEGLKTDKYDVVVNDLTPTPERRKEVDFSVPYGVEEWYIFVRSDDNSIIDRTSLRRKRVGVNTGSSNEVWARANLPDSDIQTYENSALNFNDLAAGRIDAIVSSHFAGANVIQVNHFPIKQVGAPLAYALCAAALEKNRPDLRNAIDEAITAMVADGTINRIAKKWLGTDYDMVGTIAKASKN